MTTKDYIIIQQKKYFHLDHFVILYTTIFNMKYLFIKVYGIYKKYI